MTTVSKPKHVQKRKNAEAIAYVVDDDLAVRGGQGNYRRHERSQEIASIGGIGDALNASLRRSFANAATWMISGGGT